MKALIKMGLVVAALAFAACGGDDDDDNNGTPDGSVNIPDAGTPDAQPCLVDSTLTVTPVGGQGGNSGVFRNAKQGGGTSLLWNLVVTPAGGSPIDLAQFSIDEPVTLNTPLELVNACTDQTTYCWVLLGDVTITNNTPNSNFIMFPDTGTITITETGATGAGNFKATVTASMWNHYINSMKANDGCVTNLGAITVDLPIQAGATKPSAEIMPADVTVPADAKR